MSRDPGVDGTRWLAQADDDLETARLLMVNDRHAVACFLAQQSAEKALKGLLYGAGADIVLGHSVAALCAEVAALHPELDSKCDTWSSLDQHYIPTRYPDALPGGIPSDVYTIAQSSSAIGLADEVLAAVRERLSGSAGGGL